MTTGDRCHCTACREHECCQATTLAVMAEASAVLAALGPLDADDPAN